jgi:anthranilate synthase/aminodeoxychorismate synthase-like glutamine amidotransferase
MSSVRLLLLDHYDSFVHNLARYLRLSGADTTVIRSDKISVDEIRAERFDGILLSPGPKRPEDVGIGIEVIETLASEIPMLGVCLGHQAIAIAMGGEVPCCQPVHGMASEIEHDGLGVFAGCPSPMSVGRYHSLSVCPDTLPPELIVTARTQDGIIMGLRHVSYPLHGVQFHPESVLSSHGRTIIDNFVSIIRNHGKVTR